MNCPICFKEFTNLKSWKPCYHSICNGCFKEWYLIKAKNSCPLCRQSYQKNYKVEFQFGII